MSALPCVALREYSVLACSGAQTKFLHTPPSVIPWPNKYFYLFIYFFLAVVSHAHTEYVAELKTLARPRITAITVVILCLYHVECSAIL